MPQTTPDHGQRTGPLSPKSPLQRLQSGARSRGVKAYTLRATSRRPRSQATAARQRLPSRRMPGTGAARTRTNRARGKIHQGLLGPPRRRGLSVRQQASDISLGELKVGTNCRSRQHRTLIQVGKERRKMRLIKLPALKNHKGCV